MARQKNKNSHNKVSSATISSLPPELIRCIVQEVEALSNAERDRMSLLARMGEEMGIDMEDIEAGPQAFLQTMLGLMGPNFGGPAPGGANPLAGQPNGQQAANRAPAPAPAPPAPPAPAPAQPAPQINNPPNGLFGNLFSFIGNQAPPQPTTAAQPPPLFQFNFNAAPFVPANNGAQVRAPAPTPASAPVGGDYDDMPPLIPLSDDDEDTPAQPTASTSRSQANSSTSTSTPAPPALAPDVDDFDDMPALMPLSDDEEDTPTRPSASTSHHQATGAPASDDTDDEMPALEDIAENIRPQPNPSSGSAASTLATTGAGDYDDMPPLEPLSDSDVPAAVQASTQASTSTSIPTPIPAASPAPISLEETVLSSFLRTMMVPNDEESDDEMPPLEPLDDSEDGGESGREEDEDDEDNEDGEEDHDEDGDDATYPDGLPVDPLLPLHLINRPFLHGTREKLYRDITLISIWQASLLHRSLLAPSHAARNASEIAELGTHTPSNYLPLLVRKLSFMQTSESQGGDISHNRGGASIIIDLINVCPNLTHLIVRPTLLKSSTKPFFKAVRGRKNLEFLDVTSSQDTSKPMIFTTPRIFDLMQNSLPNLSDLTIGSLKAGDEGPMHEEDEMYDLQCELDGNDEFTGDSDSEGQDADEDDWAPTRRTKPKGLTSLKLLDPDVPSDELEYILRDSAKTLKNLLLSRPSNRLSRYGLTSILLTSCTQLTELRIDTTPTWYPLPKPVNKVPYPMRPKNYKSGEHNDSLIAAISSYPHLIDAMLPYLIHLKTLRWDGPLASTSAFSFMPTTLKTLEWSHSPAIQPLPLARLLKKTVVRTKSVTNPDGSVTSKKIDTIVGKNLQCVTVRHDDLSWKESDIRQLENACSERSMCLHLSGGSMANPNGGAAGAFGLGGFIPIPIPARP